MMIEQNVHKSNWWWMRWVLLSIIILIVCFFVFKWYTQNRKINETGIVDFETCGKVYPILETYPEQCKTSDGRTFVKQY
jgi:hypothetical protein